MESICQKCIISVRADSQDFFNFSLYLFIYLFIFVFQVWRHGPVHIFRSDCRSHMLRGWRHTGRFADTYNSRERHLQETDA